MWERIKQMAVVEWVLLEGIFFTVFWILQPYIAKLLTAVLSPIFGAVLIISLIADRLDNSKIGRKFYWVMFWFSIIPLVLFFIFGQKMK